MRIIKDFYISKIVCGVFKSVTQFMSFIKFIKLKSIKFNDLI